MNFTTQKLESDIMLLTFVGRIDIASRDEVKTILQDVLDEASSAVIADLAQVGLIDSSGLSALVSGLRDARQSNKRLVLSGLNKHAQMIFSLTMMDRVFAVYKTVDDAVAALTSN